MVSAAGSRSLATAPPLLTARTIGRLMPTNFLFLMTDQHRVDTLGCYGNPVVATPNLDRLAATGTRFDRCYTPTAICAPARASLLTGAAPFRHKLLANYERNVGYQDDLPRDQFTFARALGEAGYQRGLAGKWHVGAKRTIRDFGFEGPELPGWHNPVDHPDYLAYLAEHDLPPYAITEPVRGTFPNGHPGNLLAARLQQPAEATFEYYLATRTIEMLHRFAAEREKSGRPFFLATHFFGPHLPYIIPDAYYDRYDPDLIELPASAAETFRNKPPVQERYSEHWTFDTLPGKDSRKLIAAYWGYVTLIDEQIGRILAVLDSLGLAGDTAVFFSADHGEFTGAHRLHDKGPAMYDDIYRVPLVAQVPGGAADQVDDHFVSLVDLTATFLELAGLTDEGLDGRSLLPILHGAAPTGWRQELVAEFHGHHFPYPQRMIRTERWKLVVNPADCNELYDLLADPLELQNRYLHPELSGVRDELMGRLYRELVRRGDNFHLWMPTMFTVDG